MMRKNVRTALLGVVAAAVLAGCGGGEGASPGTRGEGNIPIGKVRAIALPVARVVAVDAAGAVLTSYTDPSGMFSMPRLAAGPTTFTVEPLSSDYAAQSLSVLMGAAQANIMEVNLVPATSDAVVETMSIDLPDRKDLKVGVAVPYKVTVNGRNVKPLIPSVWVDFGRGHFESPNKFVPDSPGEGRIGAELMGKTVYLDITVK